MTKAKKKCPATCVHCNKPCAVLYVLHVGGRELVFCSEEHKNAHLEHARTCVACVARSEGTGTEVLGTCSRCLVATGCAHGRLHAEGVGELCSACYKAVSK